MKQNKYDDAAFFDKYSNMERSKKGLEAAGEWHALKRMLPEFNKKRVLDLGCGFGWHCRHAVEQGAALVVGIDISEKMLQEARQMTASPLIEYRHMPVEDIDFPEGSFDAVISSLVFHYIENFERLCAKVSKSLVSGGDFAFSVEHPIFTAEGSQQWYCDSEGNPVHWPVDRYFEEGARTTIFLGEEVCKYHRTITTYVNALASAGFEITGLVEPRPDNRLLEERGMKNELRRPMMLIFAARKR